MKRTSENDLALEHVRLPKPATRWLPQVLSFASRIVVSPTNPAQPQESSAAQLTNATRSGTLTVAGIAGGVGQASLPVSVTVSGTGLSSGAATVYGNQTWARAGATLADGNNTYTAAATDNTSRTSQDSVTINLPAAVTFQYDGNGNLTNDGRRVFEYDPPHEIADASQVWQPSRSEYAASAEKAVLAYLTGQENQLTNVYVASAWKSVFQYDAFGRRRVRKEYGWQSSAWLLTNEVRYAYDGMLVVQERDANNLALVSYTRGNDLSGTRQGAGGIGGLLARTDSGLWTADSGLAHSYYHSDGNGNITAMVDTNGFIVARYQYDPYGNLLGMSGPLAEANTYRFSSKEWHANSGLYYYGFRYYEPNLQRWLNRDPIKERGGFNIYRMGKNDGINFIDPFGFSLIDNNTSGPIVVGGNPGPGEGGGAQVFGVVPPGTTCGGNNPIPGYATREEALQAYYGDNGEAGPRSVGTIYDIDFWDNPNAANHRSRAYADHKTFGDDQGPTVRIEDVAEGSHVRLSVSPAEVASAIARAILRSLWGSLESFECGALY